MPDLAKLVINILTNFKSGYAIILHDETFFDGVGKVFDAQRRIGWRLFLGGCIASEWAQYQQRYLDWKGSRKSGQTKGGWSDR